MDIRLFLLLLQSIILSLECNYSNAKALRGNNIRVILPREFPFIGSITRKRHRSNPRDNHKCTAVLVSSKHALTAEHCMCEELRKCRFTIGSDKLSLNTKYKIEAWISYKEWAISQHISFDIDEDDDISVLTLVDEVLYIEPAFLSTDIPSNLCGMDVATAGWGTSNNNMVLDTMQTVNLLVLRARDCRRRVNVCGNVWITIPPSIICTATEPFALIAHGDSGGPLLNMNDELVGINTATCPKSELEINPQEVNLHASISYYRQFIDAIMNI